MSTNCKRRRRRPPPPPQSGDVFLVPTLVVRRRRCRLSWPTARARQTCEFSSTRFATTPNGLELIRGDHKPGRASELAS